MTCIPTNVCSFNYDPRGSGPCGVCQCVSYRAVFLHDVCKYFPFFKQRSFLKNKICTPKVLF